MKLKRSLFFALFVAFALASALAAQTQRRRAPVNKGAQTKPAAPSKGRAANSSAAGATKVVPSKSPAAAPAVFDECGCEPRALPEVLAVVNGIEIRQSDMDAQAQREIEELKREVVEARERELDLQINAILLEAEAGKRGLSVTALLEQEVAAKSKEPTEAEARDFYERNRARMQGEFAQLKDQIVEYLREQNQKEVAKSFAERLRAAAQLKVNAAKATPPANEAERARVFAVVNGQPITSADIEESLKPLVASAQESIYLTRRRALDTKINDILLGDEARKRNTTAEALLDAEVNSKVPTVDEAAARKFYEENRSRINGAFEQVKYQIIQYIEDQAKQRALAKYAQGLRNQASVQTHLRAPEAPVFQIATDDQPEKGNPSALVTLIEFTDYECPSCAQTQPVIDRIAAEYADRVRIVVRDFPLAQHKHAFKAAEAAEAAREQGKYWEYVSVLFRNQSALTIDRLKEYAGHLGLDRARFDAALDSGKFAEKVRRDMQEAMRLGVNSTPTIFVNGKRVNERTYEGLKSVIEEALKSASNKQLAP